MRGPQNIGRPSTFSVAARISGSYICIQADPVKKGTLAFFDIAATMKRLFFYNARWILRGRNGFDGVDVRPRLRVELLGKLVKHLETTL